LYQQKHKKAVQLLKLCKNKMKSKLEKLAFQNLYLEVGDRASSEAGYPKKSLVVVECIKKFSEAKDLDFILNNSNEFVKVIHYGLIGISTSHLCSSGWVAEDVRFN
jgi:hypothetical protein